MKHIEKQPEPQALIEWKTPPGADPEWNPSYNDMPSDVKNAVKQMLMEEQRFICCYCERRLEESDSHIEHIQPQKRYPEESLNYRNMLCSCQQKLQPGEPRHCGVLKEDWYDSNLFVLPLDPACEKRFTHTGAGEILPRIDGDLAARTTIDRLGLNIPRLQALRRGAIEPFIIDERLSNDDIRQFVTIYLELDKQGRFNPFYTTIRDLFLSA